MKAEDIAKKAADLVGGDRQQQHGDKTANHAAIAALWNGIIEARKANGKTGPLDALDVANMMEALKIARRYSGKHNDDDYVDAAGYAAVAGEIACSAALDEAFSRPRAQSVGKRAHMLNEAIFNPLCNL